MRQGGRGRLERKVASSTAVPGQRVWTGGETSATRCIDGDVDTGNKTPSLLPLGLPLGSLARARAAMPAGEAEAGAFPR